MKDNAEYIGQKYYCMYCGEPDKYKPSQIEPHWTIHKKNHITPAPTEEANT